MIILCLIVSINLVATAISLLTRGDRPCFTDRTYPDKRREA